MGVLQARRSRAEDRAARQGGAAADREGGVAPPRRDGRGPRAPPPKRVVHRDLKPANAFVASDGTIKLGDLNVCKVQKNGTALCGTKIGTPYYMAPEIWMSQPYDAVCDMWSLGCVVYELIALKPPFTARNIKELQQAVQAARCAPPPTPTSRCATSSPRCSSARPRSDRARRRCSTTPRRASRAPARARRTRREPSSLSPASLPPVSRLPAPPSLSFSPVRRNTAAQTTRCGLVRGRRRPGRGRRGGDRHARDHQDQPARPEPARKLTSKLPTACYPDARPNSPRAWPASVRRQAALERERLRQDVDDEDSRQEEQLAQGGAVAAVRAIERAPPATAIERAPPRPSPRPRARPRCCRPGGAASRAAAAGRVVVREQPDGRARACRSPRRARLRPRPPGPSCRRAKPPPVHEDAEMPAEDLLRVVAKPSEPPLPAGWRAVPSRSRPGECSYLNTATGERVMQRPTRTGGVTADERKPLVKLGVSKRAAGMPSARSEVIIARTTPTRRRRRAAAPTMAAARRRPRASRPRSTTRGSPRGTTRPEAAAAASFSRGDPACVTGSHHRPATRARRLPERSSEPSPSWPAGRLSTP